MVPAIYQVKLTKRKSHFPVEILTHSDLFHSGNSQGLCESGNKPGRH